MSDDEVCYLLASCAGGVSEVIMGMCASSRVFHSSKRRSTAGQIGTKLHLIHTYLKSLPPYWIDPALVHLSRSLLKRLADICVWPQNFQVLQVTLIRQCHECIVSRLAQKKQPELKKSLTKFFNESDECRLKEFELYCGDFFKGLILDDVDEMEGLPASVEHLDEDELSPHFNQQFFDTLKRHCQCDPSLHEMPVGDVVCQDLRHPARLCLANDAVSLDILIASTDMALWQELHLKIRADNQPSAESQLLLQGDICTLLERQPNARIMLLFEPRYSFYNPNQYQELDQDFLPGRGESLSSVLRNYQLTPKDKVILSYSMARAYWQFYDSELVRTEWTSESIWFMPEENGGKPKDMLPLRSYLTFPFGVPNNPVQDFLHDARIIHRCPRLFTIGKLLLEIGLSELVPAKVRKDRVSQANSDYRKATTGLEKLRSMKWDGLPINKRYFDDAVAYCFDSANFIRFSNQPKSAPQNTLKSVSANMNAEQDEIRARRKTFYKHVVRPLAWLARTGFGTLPQQVTYISKKSVSSPNRQLDDLQLQPEPEFHSGTDVAKKWLQDLNKISAHVKLIQRRRRISVPIRVAILDTGFDYTLPAFENDNRRVSCIKDKKDFVDTERSSTMTDTFGHGTLMTRIVMECAPFAEMIVARVAKSTGELDHSQNKIAEAILWAVLDCKADIVSMSFGFPNDDKRISDAIHTAHSSRNGAVIFLASAGNSPTEDESFPARHPSVISVYATDCYGEFMKSNAIASCNGPAILGTFGDNIPNEIAQEFETKFPNVYQPGTSIATAVAAGTSAIILAYATVLPSVLKTKGTPEQMSTPKLKRLWESKGMESLLYKMALDKHNRRWFVNLIWFWKEKRDDYSRWVVIYDCMSKFEFQHPLLSG